MYITRCFHSGETRHGEDSSEMDSFERRKGIFLRPLVKLEEGWVKRRGRISDLLVGPDVIPPLAYVHSKGSEHKHQIPTFIMYVVASVRPLD